MGANCSTKVHIFMLLINIQQGWYKIKQPPQKIGLKKIYTFNSEKIGIFRNIPLF